MGVQFRNKLVCLSGVVTVEDAEALLDGLQKKPGTAVDFSACEHLHPASLQVLMAAGAAVVAWPADAGLAMWLQSALPAAVARPKPTGTRRAGGKSVQAGSAGAAPQAGTAGSPARAAVRSASS
jgi:hypothetical protein